MISFNSFGLRFVSFLFIVIIVLLLKLLDLFIVLTLISSSLLLWLFWKSLNYWSKYFSKEIVSISGKAVLITGCDSRFGFLSAQALNKKGFTVFAGYLNEKCESAQYLRNLNIKTLEMDVTNEEQVIHSRNNIENYLKETNSELWALVNNADLFTCGYVEWGHINDLKKVLDVNVIGLVQTTRHFLPLIRKSKGRVINMLCSTARFTFPTLSFYSMSKYAVLSFSEALRREMLLWDVKVITIETMRFSNPKRISEENRLRSSLMDLWQKTPSEVKLDYGENLFHSYKEFVATKTIRSSHRVIESVLDSITNGRPKIRYQCSTIGYTIIFWCLETLSTQFLDKFFYLYSFFTIKPRAIDNGF